MINDVSSAVNAYQQALGRLSGMNRAVEPEKAQEESGFGDILKTAMNNAENVVKKSETLSMQGIAGKADVQDVVLAIANAEQTLETVVAFRDTAVKAYKEILQMTV